MALALGLGLVAACGEGEPDDGRTKLVFPGSRVGAEGRALAAALERFAVERPDIQVKVQATPDAAGQRHQLYVSWLSAGEPDPDVLQLDVVWTAEFAGAGWVRPLDPYGASAADFFPAAAEAASAQGQLFALPWFVDVGMLYWRTDLVETAPTSFDALAADAAAARDRAGLPYGLVLQAARYEGLVTVFLEYLTGMGGRILDDDQRIVVSSPAGVRALTALRDAIAPGGIVPREALAWTEERTRLAFQGGRSVFMRNWPYAYALLQDPAASEVAGRFAVAPMPAGPGGRPSAALGGQLLAVSAHSDVPDAAYALVAFLASPAEQLERARVTGQLPARPEVYDDPALASALAIPPEKARAVIARAVPRPGVAVWSELSDALQIHLHRALEGSETPEAALAAAARTMQAILDRTEATDTERPDPAPARTGAEPAATRLARAGSARPNPATAAPARFTGARQR